MGVGFLHRILVSTVHSGSTRGATLNPHRHQCTNLTVLHHHHHHHQDTYLTVLHHHHQDSNHTVLHQQQQLLMEAIARQRLVSAANIHLQRLTPLFPTTTIRGHNARLLSCSASCSLFLFSTFERTPEPYNIVTQAQTSSSARKVKEVGTRRRRRLIIFSGIHQLYMNFLFYLQYRDLNFPMDLMIPLAHEFST